MIAEQDKVRARHHMGYGGVNQAYTFQGGVPAATQTSFMIEGAFSRILPSTEPHFRDLLDKLDSVEQQLLDDTENLAVDSIDEIHLRADEMKELIKRYLYWQGGLGNLLQVPPNPFDQRPGIGMGYGGSGGINVPVR